MNKQSCIARVAAGCMSVLTGSLLAAEASPAVVSHVKVLSDKVQDVSSLEAWRKSFIDDRMNNTEKAIAVWKSVVAFTFDGPPAREMLEDENNVRDPIKAFNVYGYGLCSDGAAFVETLGRSIGFEARGWAFKGHSVPELYYDNGWHLLDGAYINYWPKADGTLAGVEEMAAQMKEFRASHPELDSDSKLKEFSKNGGWRKGPEIMSRCPVLDENGIAPEGYHGWWSFANYLVNKPFVYEYGTAAGYELNIQLRPGEKLVRNWSHKNLYVNMDGLGGKPNLTPVGKAQLAYSPKFGDLAEGRIGNGRLEYAVPLEQISASALGFENLEVKSKALRVKDGGQPGVLTIRMPSSYVYLTGEVELKASLPVGGELAVELSDSNGLSWRPVGSAITASGAKQLDLKDLVYRRYDYRLRFTLKGAGASLDMLAIRHDIQHSQRALPALAQGANRIRFSAGPQEGTITYQGSMYPANKGKQVTVEDLQPVLTGLSTDRLKPGESGKGEALFNIATPGELTRLRFGLNWRARGAGDHYDVQVSFDEGKTFKSVRKLTGPTNGQSTYLEYSDIPAGVKAAQVRIAARQQNTLLMFAMRIGADYREPGGGFWPVKITYEWEEDGKVRQDIHVARSAEEAYSISCNTRPRMKAISLELAEQY